MRLGKVLRFAALGVAAVAAAPFTGGGSILAATTAAGSLAGAGAVAAAAGAATVGAGVGKVLSDRDERKEEEIKEENASLNIKAQKYEKEIKEAIKRFEGDKEYFNYIIATTAIGISMANADGEISEEERLELDEFVGGIAQSNYPEHIKDSIHDIYKNPPSFNAAIQHLEKVNPSNYESIKDMLELVMEADGVIHEKEKAFLSAFESSISMIEYRQESEDNENQFLLEIKETLVA
jgi:uncharacterized tellurite resistance protein B-like protein